MRIVGSRWTKRDLHGIRAGLTDDRPGAGMGNTDLQVGTISRITAGADYVSPPGVADQVQDPTSLYGSAGVEYNEKSLRLAYRDLEPGDRAEVYFRYPQQPRNLLAYRDLRIWALARAGRWGGGDTERLVISAGTDPRNRYLFQTTLRAAPAGAEILPEAWLPELTIDFEEWFELKARAEAIMIAGEHPGTEPLVLWDQDSIYGIILEDRARAPNLAAVRELAFAVYNAAGLPATGEVWIDDLRVGGAVRDVGVAGHWEMAVAAGDFASASVSYGSRGGLFRQLDGEASYRTTAELGVNSTAQLGKLAPAGWALDLPLTVTHTRLGHDPTFLELSDVRADRFPGVRETGATQTRVTLSLRRATPSDNPWAGWLLDGAYLRLGYQTATARALTSRDDSEGTDIGIGYAYRPAVREVDPLPAPLETALRALLPAALEESAIVRRLAAARIRWTPTEISVSSFYNDQVNRSYRFTSIVATPEDSGVRPIEAPRRGLDAMARIAFQPIHSMAAALSYASNRDLLPADRAAVQPLVQRALNDARTELAGLDLGWERQRILESRVDFRPMVTTWLRPGLGYTARFRGDRNATYWEPVVVGDDTTATLHRHYQADRQFTRSLALDPERLGDQLASPGAEPPHGATLALAAALRALRPIDLAWSDGVDSRFEREAIGPGLGYQFGLGRYDLFRTGPAHTASTARERDSFRARGGLRLPLHAQFDIAYHISGSDAYQRGGGRYIFAERSWPDLMLTWSEIPAPASLRGAISHSAASVGYQRTRHAGRAGSGVGGAAGGGGGIRTGEEINIPVRFTIGLVNGFSGSYTGLRGEGLAGDPTGQTEQEVAQHAVQLAGRLVAPAVWNDGDDAPIRIALSFSIHSRRQCRVQAAGIGTNECVPFVDLVHRQLALTMDTIISQLNVGFQMSYFDRKSFVGIQSGSSQFQLGLFGEFNFEAGSLRGGAR
jgi:hypothetical protein